jgi:predicted nucleic acid-binding protein
VARLRPGLVGTLVLDAEGLVKLARGNLEARALARHAYRRGSTVVTAASTLAEILRGGPADTPLHRALAKIKVIPIESQQGRAAGELLGRAGLSGHRCALDALLAVIALDQPRPVVLLTSDPRDLARLTEEPERPRAQRVKVIRV